MRRFSKRVRLYFGGIALLIFAADVWWILHRSAREDQQFYLHTTIAAVKLSDDSSFPVYDPVTSTWRVNGKRIASLHSFVQNWNDGPDGIGKFVVVRVGGREAMADVRDTLLALVDQGICQTGLTDKGSRDDAGTREVSVLKIDWVRAPDGTKHRCIADVR